MAPDPKSFLLTDALHSYLLAHSTPMDDVVLDLIAETTALGDPAGMQIAPEQGSLLTLLTRLSGARTAVEVGTFTGFSALCIARGLPPGGRLVCCDVSEEWTAVARRYWQRAGVADRIELVLGPAAETLAAMPTEPHIDLAFIDADKSGYAVYFEALVTRLRPGGLIGVDNTLWGGEVLDPTGGGDDAAAIRSFNDRVAGDRRVDTLLLPIADGFTLLHRRP